jgi:hypothetical protein
MSFTAWLPTRASGYSALLGVVALVLLGTVRADAAASPQAHTRASSLSVRMVGTFSFHSCATAPSADLCLTDDLTGSVPELGPVNGVFEVDIQFSQQTADGCSPVLKRGSFTTADGSTVRLAATGFFCNETGIVAYDYRVVGGTRRLADAAGRGQWVVPSPTTSSSTGGVGFEFFFGMLEVHQA